MALTEPVQALQNPLAGGPVIAPDDLEQARREGEERLDLERQINFAIDEINANPNIPSELKTELVNTLRSLKTGLGANPNLAQVQKEINDARATAQYAATTNAIYNSLSDAGQAQFLYRSNALSEGRFSDYYFSVTDKDNLFSDETKRHLAGLMDDDPEVKAREGVSKAIPKIYHDRRDAEIIKREEELDELIRNEADPAKRLLLEKARNANLMHDKEGGRAFLDGVISGDYSKATEELDKIIAEKAEAMKKRVPVGSELYSRLKQNEAFLSADGHSVDFEKLIRYELEHKQEIANAMNKKNERLLLTDEEKTLASFGEQFAIMDQAHLLKNANLFATSLMLEHQPDLQATLADKSVPAADRARQLEEALLRSYEQRKGSLSDDVRSQIRNDTRSIVAAIDSNSTALSVLVALRSSNDKGASARQFIELNEAAISQSRINDGLSAMGFGEVEISRLNKIARSSPELDAIMRNSFLDVETRAMSVERQKIFFTNVALGGGPSEDSREAISITQYYNLGHQSRGSQLRLDIYNGEIEPAKALAEAREMQQAALGRMTSYESIVNHFVTEHATGKHLHAGQNDNPTQKENLIEPNDYEARLKNLGMYNADGSLNVEKIIETARKNRDSLGTKTDAEIGAISNRSYFDPEMPEEYKDMRVVARTAARFKAIESIQTYGREIDNALQRSYENGIQPSPELLKAQENYNVMTNASGMVSVAEQRAAIEAHLSQQQYFKATPDLKEIVAENIVELSQRAPYVLLSHEFANNERIILEQQFIAPVNLTADEVYALRNEGKTGERLFGTKIESNIRQVLQGKEMSEIVQVFGQYMTGADGTQFNGGNENNISVYELQNALMGTNKATKGSDRDRVFEETDKDKDGRLSVTEILERLKTNGGLTSSAADAQTVSASTPPPAQAVPASSGPATPTPTPGR